MLCDIFPSEATLCPSPRALPGSRVHVLRLPAGPLGAAGVQPVVPKEPLTLPPPATSPGLEVPQLQFHAHWVSSRLAIGFSNYGHYTPLHFSVGLCVTLSASKIWNVGNVSLHVNVPMCSRQCFDQGRQCVISKKLRGSVYL